MICCGIRVQSTVKKPGASSSTSNAASAKPRDLRAAGNKAANNLFLSSSVSSTLNQRKLTCQEYLLSGFKQSIAIRACSPSVLFGILNLTSKPAKMNLFRILGTCIIYHLSSLRKVVNISAGRNS